MKGKKSFRSLVALIMSISLTLTILPQNTWATTRGGSYSYSWTEEYTYEYEANPGSGNGSKSAGSIYKYEKASNIDKLIEICKKYSDINTITDSNLI